MKNILVVLVVLIATQMLFAEKPETRMVCEYVLNPNAGISNNSNKIDYIMVCKPVVVPVDPEEPEDPEEYNEEAPIQETSRIVKPAIQNVFQKLNFMK